MELNSRVFIIGLLMYSTASSAWWWPNSNQQTPYQRPYPTPGYYPYYPTQMPRQAFIQYNAIEIKKASDYAFAKIMEESKIKRQAMIKHLQEKQAEIKKKMEARQKRFEDEILAQRKMRESMSTTKTNNKQFDSEMP